MGGINRRHCQPFNVERGKSKVRATDAPEPAHDADYRYEFSVVIPTYQRRDVLIRTLNALAKLLTPGRCELIVVVDGSTDGSAETARAVSLPFPVMVIEQPNAGAAAARNRGAAAAQGEFLLFLDDDMQAAPELLVEHGKVLRAGADAVVGSVPLHPEAPATLLTPGVARWARQRHDRLVRTEGALTLPDLLTGQLSVRATAFKTINGFDTRFTAGGTFGAEDTDFLYRLLTSGMEIRFAPGATSYQWYVVTPEQNLRQWRQAGRADVVLTRKHPALSGALAKRHGSRSLTGAFVRTAGERCPAPLGRAVTRTVLKRAAADRTDLATQWAFSLVRDAHYWRGVREGGGLAGQRPAPRVLAYHIVEDIADPVLRPYSVTPEQFERQMEALSAAGFDFVGPEELLSGLDGRPIPNRSVLISFDDGYTNNYDHAAPVLERLGIPAVLFVVTDQIGRWNAWDAAHGGARLPLMTVEQLTELTTRGWEIGAHSKTHSHLSLLSPTELKEELVNSRDELVRAGLPSPRLLAYPYGEHNARVRHAAERSGYAAAFALTGARTTVEGRNRFAVPRIEVTRELSPDQLVRLALNPPRQRWRDLSREARGAGRAALHAARRARMAWPATR